MTAEQTATERTAVVRAGWFPDATEQTVRVGDMVGISARYGHRERIAPIVKITPSGRIYVAGVQPGTVAIFRADGTAIDKWDSGDRLVPAAVIEQRKTEIETYRQRAAGYQQLIETVTAIGDRNAYRHGKTSSRMTAIQRETLIAMIRAL